MWVDAIDSLYRYTGPTYGTLTRDDDNDESIYGLASGGEDGHQSDSGGSEYDVADKKENVYGLHGDMSSPYVAQGSEHESTYGLDSSLVYELAHHSQPAASPTLGMHGGAHDDVYDNTLLRQRNLFSRHATKPSSLPSDARALSEDEGDDTYDNTLSRERNRRARVEDDAKTMVAGGRSPRAGIDVDAVKRRATPGRRRISGGGGAGVGRGSEYPHYQILRGMVEYTASTRDVQAHRKTVHAGGNVGAAAAFSAGPVSDFWLACLCSHADRDFVEGAAHSLGERIRNERKGLTNGI